jgi:2-dehydro-3-deoxyphosphooctonate aldolase (KDO 8-P synthase)
MMNKHVTVRNLKIGNDLPLTIIAGPCQMESREHALEMAEALINITRSLSLSFIYKTSFDKANRTSSNSKRGIGLEKSLSIFQEIREKFGCPVITDVHTAEQCSMIAPAVDALQIPAFLCRQTDLLVAAANTGLPLNIKKGQFLAPWDVINIAKKIEDTGHTQFMFCERGTSFGYNTLIVDMKSLPIMAKTGYPVVFDATHSVQQPGGLGTQSGGQREFAPILSRAAVSLGIAAVFLETHQDPDNAPSDGPNMIYLRDMLSLLTELKEVDEFAKKHPIHLK